MEVYEKKEKKTSMYNFFDCYALEATEAWEKKKEKLSASLHKCLHLSLIKDKHICVHACVHYMKPEESGEGREKEKEETWKDLDT